MQELFNVLTELWNTGNTALVLQLYHDQVVRFDPNLPQPARGAQEVANYVAEVRKGFPDFKLEIKERIAAENQMATEWKCTGTHNGEFQGIPPTGRHVNIGGVTLSRIEGNKIMEERNYFDRLELLQQLGVAPGTSQGEAKGAAQR